jgi:aminotransferase
MRKAYDERRRYLLFRFKEMGLPWFTPKGAFYVFPEIRKLGMSSEEFAIKLLKA